MPYAASSLRLVIKMATSIATAAACLLTVSACSGNGSTAATVSFTPDHRKAAPDLQGTTIRDNKPFSLGALKGQVVVINYWASWCDPCREEVPQLEQTYQDFNGKGVSFIGVDFHGDGDKPDNALSFMRSHHVPYDSLFDPDSTTVLQFKGKVSIEAPPVTLVIDKQGRIANLINGVVVYSDLHKFVTDALSEPA